MAAASLIAVNHWRASHGLVPSRSRSDLQPLSHDFPLLALIVWRDTELSIRTLASLQSSGATRDDARVRR